GGSGPGRSRRRPRSRSGAVGGGWAEADGERRLAAASSAPTPAPCAQHGEPRGGDAEEEAAQLLGRASAWVRARSPHQGGPVLVDPVSPLEGGLGRSRGPFGGGMSMWDHEPPARGPLVLGRCSRNQPSAAAWPFLCALLSHMPDLTLMRGERVRRLFCHGASEHALHPVRSSRRRVRGMWPSVSVCHMAPPLSALHVILFLIPLLLIFSLLTTS
ncbi:unnamed protein product, partial [Prorocentrum cordatum]